MPEFIHTGKDKKKFVKKMFDDISDNYDILNRILSFGIDKYWRNPDRLKKDMLGIMKRFKDRESVENLLNSMRDVYILRLI